MARQDPRYRGREEGKDVKRTYSIKADTGKMTLVRTPDELLPKKVFYGEFQDETALKEAKRNATKIPLSLTEGFQYSWEQAT